MSVTVKSLIFIFNRNGNKEEECLTRVCLTKSPNFFGWKVLAKREKKPMITFTDQYNGSANDHFSGFSNKKNRFRNTFFRLVIDT